MPGLAGSLTPELTTLLERDGQLAALREQIDLAERGRRGSVVLLSGEAGGGKTTLVRRFCDEAAPTRRLLAGSCDPLFTPRPLGPMLTIAEQTGGELEEVVTRGLTPYDVVSALARELHARKATILVLEDVHWADDATLDVLRLLSRRIESVPALVIATYRDDELHPTHPLRLVVGELATNAAVRRLALGPLSAAAVAQLAERHDIDAAELYGKTAGNPFFVVEVLAAGAGAIPATVRDAVLARAARLTTGARRLLEAVATVPPRAELWLLSALVDRPGESIEECLGSGMLAALPGAVAFRHEIARLAVESAIDPARRIELHRRALSALMEPPSGKVDAARAAHHAEGAGDAEAVLRFAPAAGAAAAATGSHREAAAQFARALRFGESLPPADRAGLFEGRSRACYLTDQYEEGIAAIESALMLRRALGETLAEGDALRQLSDFLWCPGRTAESMRAAEGAVAALEPLAPSKELALAYTNLAFNRRAACDLDEALVAAGHALALASSLDEPEIALYARALAGSCELEAGTAKVEQSLAAAEEAGLPNQVANAYHFLVTDALDRRDHAALKRHLGPAMAHASERGLELARLYLLAAQARFELQCGLWAEAAATATRVLQIPRTSTSPRIQALVVLGLVRARRGEADAWPLLDEARSLAEPTGELPRLAPVAAARAEAAWLEGRPTLLAAEIDAAFALAEPRRAPWLAGELAVWRRRAGIDHGRSGLHLAEPYRLELAGNWAEAESLWHRIGCPYDAALAAAAGADEEGLRRAHRHLQLLGAVPAAAVVARKLQQLGVRGVPRGPRPATRDNPVGLTGREMQVLELVAEGLSNTQIAGRLVLSRRTVDHHVSAILRKLGASSRTAASAAAVKHGLLR